MKRFLALFICICVFLCGCETRQKITSSFFIPDIESEPISEDVEDLALKSLGKLTAGEFLYEDICFEVDNVPATEEFELAAEAAGAFCVTDRSVLFSKNIYKKVYPASTTKLLTALTAFKYGNLDDVYVVQEDNCGVTTPGAQLCGFKKGDTLTLEQLLYCLMIYSGNDAAVAVAECVAGSVKDFVGKMNEEAARLGAKDTHMSNPNGLHALDHYTTPFDIYLIFNECLKNKQLTEIISTKNYTCVFKDAAGAEKTFEMEATNQYFSGKKEAPEGITVLSGKTGVTVAAGYCLIILSQDKAGKQYITCAFKSTSYDQLYADMNELLKLCK
ncbi:MAG: D-alanyl-D-alanine carboxypeptidase [Lachnospiraceae bacterium]|jgi:D-alanyl-D-alanine carboxypeptidase (penicillin-binding protein 5/6)|nr:D-alanyl-D-alanine carboxypeptidase [Lachnospiraceae bacterium]MBR4815882.1 D-alanyl-D-alanine carboxypeptidase [Lachnospiraceae bacterium]